MKPPRFDVLPEVFAAFPGMRIAVVVVRGIDNGAERPEAAAIWRRDWASALDAAVHGNSQSHPRVSPWREAWRANGISAKKFPSSIEALLRRALKGGQPFSISPLVDFYNGVSLRRVVPAGGFDLGDLAEPLVLRATRAGDTFQALDAAEPEEVPPGEIGYASGPTILTRHLVWRQSRVGRITPATRDAILVSEILQGLPEDLVDQVLEDLAGGLAELFGIAAETTVVDAANPGISPVPPPTDRLRFRRFRRGDEERVLAMLADEYAQRFFSFVDSLDMARRWIERQFERYQEDGHGFWALERLSDGAFVGDCGVAWQETSEGRLLEVGYHLDETERGKGYATEAARGALHHAFASLGAERVVSMVALDNLASRKVAERIHREVSRAGFRAANGEETAIDLFSTSRSSWLGGAPGVGTIDSQ